MGSRYSAHRYRGNDHRANLHRDFRATISAALAWTPMPGMNGTPIGKVGRTAGIAEAAFYNWRKRYAGLLPSEMKRLRQLEEEDVKLKRLVADLSLDKTMLQDVLRRKWQALRQHSIGFADGTLAASARRSSRCGERSAGRLSGQRTAGLPGHGVSSIFAAISLAPGSSDGAAAAITGPGCKPGALRLSAFTCAPEAGGLASECEANLASV